MNTKTGQSRATAAATGTKTYLEAFLDSAETQYASGIMPLMSLSQLNDSVKFSPIQKSKYTGGNGKYVIQRAKRIKAVDLAAASGKAGDDAVSRLNALTKVDWATIETSTSAEKIIGVTIEPNEAFDMDGVPSDFMRPLSNKVKNTLIEGEELATAKVIAAGAKSVLDITSNEKAAKSIEDAIEKIELLVDDFKAYSDKVVVLVHPTVAKMFSKLQGMGYQTGTNTFPNGLGKGFRYEGYDFFVSPILNAVESSADKVAGAIVMDREAYANMGIAKGITTFDETNTGTRAVGHRYYGLDIVVDSDRIKVLEIDKVKANQTKKVNA